jgi:hypothetical protein
MVPEPPAAAVAASEMADPGVKIDAPAGLVMDTVGAGCAATGPVHVVPLMVKTVGAVLVPL